MFNMLNISQASAQPPLHTVPAWLTSGPAIFIAITILISVLFYVWANIRINYVQREVRKLGLGYHEKERILYTEYRSGKMTKMEYRRRHNELIGKMRDESMKISDGSPRR